MKREEFLNTACTLVGLGLLDVLQSCSKPSVVPKPPANFTIDLTNSSYDALKTIGGVVDIQGIYIIRTGPSAYLALSHVCTHEGCSVGYNSASKNFVCPCHGGTYDINGKVVSGPPQSALAQYQTVLDGTNLTITG